MVGIEEKKQIEEEIRNLDQLMKANDYIGIKIAMGRATREEYAEEIAKSEEWAQRKSELQALLDGTAEEEQPEETTEQTEEPAEEENSEAQNEGTEEPDEAQTEETIEEEQPEETEEQTEEPDEG